MAGAYNDVRLKALRYAVLAPSPQNRQPWSVELRGERQMVIYVDRDRVPTLVDPVARQVFLSHGAFLELLCLAAQGMGYRAVVRLLPEGCDSFGTTWSEAVAVVELTDGEDAPDPLLDQVSRRVTNRRRYRGPPLTGDEIRSLKGTPGIDESSLVVINDQGALRQLADIMTHAMRIETFLDEQHGEKVSMIRSSNEQMAATRDGFSYPNLGYTGVARRAVEAIFPLSMAYTLYWRWATVAVAKVVARSSRAIGLVLSEGNTRADQINAGRAFMRVWLHAAGLGLAIHPMSQALQEYAEMEAARMRLAEVLERVAPGAALPTLEMGAGAPTVQALFRIGRAPAAPPAPRRPVEHLLRRGS